MKKGFIAKQQALLIAKQQALLIAKQQALLIRRKALLFFGVGIFLVLVGFALGRISLPKEKFNFSPNQKLSSSQTATPTPSSVEEIFKVIRVIDGDTIEIDGGRRVRYLGIDTPETVDPRKPVECFGVEASKKNKEIVEGKNVRLEKDISEKDKYGRLLRYVWVDDILVNLELVEQGFATSYTYPPDVKHQAEILTAEAEAREANRGLWGTCPVVSPTIAREETPKNNCDIKGNISSTGEKIYHLPGCGSYTKTKIDEGRGERWFCSEEEARASGWRKALNCP